MIHRPKMENSNKSVFIKLFSNIFLKMGGDKAKKEVENAVYFADRGAASSYI